MTRAKTKKPKVKKPTEGLATQPAVDQFILNCDPSTGAETDWSTETAILAGIIEDAAIPPQTDLRTAWWSVGNQGQTGSCVGWAVADSALRWHFVNAQGLPTNERLSVRQVWMASKEIDELDAPPTSFVESAGTTIKSALDVARKFGVVSEDVLPFAVGGFLGETKEFYALASRLKIANYFNLGRQQVEWRKWLATKGPIVTRLDVDQSWYDATTSGGALTQYQPLPPGRGGGHAVALVGYTEKMFIVRNSWGQDWGDGGFAYASNEYAAVAFTEAYGLTI